MIAAMRGFGLAFALLIVLGLGRTEAAFIANVSTGLDASNNLITTGGTADAHWIVGQLTGGTAAAQVVEPGNADYFGGWAPNGPNSAFIARNANVSSNGPAPYTFSTTFNLTGFDLSTVSISGRWGVDDNGTLALNGNTIALGVATYASLPAFSVASGSSFLNQGLNTLSITITSTDNFLEGVRLEGTVTSNAVVPEPASLVLVGIASFSSLGFWMTMRRKANAA